MTTAEAPAGAKPSAVTQSFTDADVLASVAGAAWVGKALVVADRERVEGNKEKGIRAIRRRELSASTSKSVAGCAARFAIETMLPRAVNPTGPAELGTVAHEVLEHFYEREPDKRTLTSLRRGINPAIRNGLAAFDGTLEYDELFGEVKKTITPWVENIFDVENPSEVNVFQTEMAFKGIKLSNGVPFIGFLDRTRVEGDPSDMSTCTLHIDDYKFGKKVKRPSSMYGDDYGDQMRIYSDAIQQTFGKPAGSATLLWPRQKQKVEADLGVAATRATLASFLRSWDYMNQTADAAVFPASPSPLCGWCPAVNSCPSALVKSANAQANARKMHGGPEGPVDLGIPVVREFTPAPRMNEVTSTVPATTTTTQEHPVTQNLGDKLAFPTNKWAVMATASLTDTAATHLDIYGQKLMPATIQSLTNALAGIVIETHEQVFMGGFDWTFDSASRTVFSLNASLRSRPAPFGQDADAWAKWRKTLIGLTAAKLRIAIPLVEHTTPEPPNFDALLVNTTIPEPKHIADAPVEPVPA